MFVEVFVLIFAEGLGEEEEAIEGGPEFVGHIGEELRFILAGEGEVFGFGLDFFLSFFDLGLLAFEERVFGFEFGIGAFEFHLLDFESVTGFLEFGFLVFEALVGGGEFDLLGFEFLAGLAEFLGLFLEFGIRGLEFLLGALE